MNHVNSRVCGILTTILLLLVIPPSVSAANFKIKPLVVSGDSAPDGGTFTFISSFSMNNLGSVAFSGFTSIGSGIYLASNEPIQRVIKSGDSVVIPELLLSGELVKKEFIPRLNETSYQFTDGHRFSCRQTFTLQGFNSFKPVLINDNGDIVFHHGFSGSPVVFTGGTLTSPFGCPGLTHLIMDLNPEDPFQGINDAIASAVNNAGMIALKLFIRPFTTPRGFFGERHFLISGGIPNLLTLVDTEAPGGGTIFVASFRALNDSGDALVFFNEQLFPVPQSRGFFIQSGDSRIPVAVTGQPALDGKTFRDVGVAGDMNNAGEIVFTAQLSDFRRYILRRSPVDGMPTSLVRQFDPMPGGGVFFELLDVKINDAGDVVFRSTAFGAPGGIFLRKANGGLSKVVPEGASIPGVGTLNAIGNFQINNKGQIAFQGFLTNGKSGIFLAGAGLETEFVDPVPDLLAGSAVTSDPTMLASNGTKVTGIAADGAARVVVRVKTGQTGTAEFSLVDENGAALPPSNFNGSLSQVGEDLGSSSVSVSAMDVEGFGPMAFATYHAPVDFSTGPSSKEAGDPDRKVSIRIRLRTATGETVESTESIGIVRPPVVLVHGLWESLSDWNTFTPLVNDSNFFIKRANYNFSITGITDSTPDFPPDILAKTTTNALGFTFNASFVLGQIIGFIDDFKSSQQVAAIQADLVGHSMGGNVARNLPLIPGFFSDKTFGKGTIHKIVTIGTPHLGTPLATQLLKNANSCVRDQLAANENISFRSVSFQGRTLDGGVFELEGDGVGGALSRALRSLQQPGSHLLPTAMVAGVMSQAQLNGLSDLFSAATFIRLRCAGDPLADSLNFQDWPTIFGQDSDAIVPLTSQFNGLFGSRFTAVHSSGTVRLGFRPPHEYEEASNISLEVIKLLNASLTSGSFHLLPP